MSCDRAGGTWILAAGPAIPGVAQSGLILALADQGGRRGGGRKRQGLAPDPGRPSLGPNEGIESDKPNAGIEGGVPIARRRLLNPAPGRHGTKQGG